MEKEFKCPNCGAPLDSPMRSETSVRCPFCSTTVIVPDELIDKSTNGVQIFISSGNIESDVPGMVNTKLDTYFESHVKTEKGLKLAKGVIISSAGIGIISSIVIAAFIGCILIVMLTLPGGPLETTWIRMNPFGNLQNELIFGGEGSGPGLFSDVRSIAIDHKTGNIVTADYQGGRVQVFDSKGKFLNQWYIGDRKTIITNIATDKSGNIYIVASGKIFRFTGISGKPGGEAIFNDKNEYYENISIDPQGNLVAVTMDDSIIKFNSNLQPVYELKEAIKTISGDSELTTKTAIDARGFIYALGENNHGVFKFSPDGKYLNRFGSKGDAKDQFTAPNAIAVDAAGNVLVSDFVGVKIFNSEGRYLGFLDIPGIVFGMAFDENGYFYVVSNRQMVLKYLIKL